MKYASPSLPPLSLFPVLLALFLLILGPGVASAANGCAVLDNLQGISTDSRFANGGTGGQAVIASQATGPRFTLSETTTITEIGAFLNNCVTILAGVPQCPDTSSLVVQIRPEVGGVPSPTTVLGTFVLSQDDDPLAFSYESAQVDLTLGPGVYFALFAPQELGEGGSLLSSASNPFPFQAGASTLGFLDLTTGRSFVSSSPLSAAVRILRRCALAVTLDVKPRSFPNTVNPRSQGVIPVAVLSTAGFDATRIDPDTLAFGPAGAEPVHAVLKDVNGDRRTDLLLHFRTQETGITCATTSVTLTGATRDGQSIEGTDSVRTVGCK